MPQDRLRSGPSAGEDLESHPIVKPPGTAPWCKEIVIEIRSSIVAPSVLTTCAAFASQSLAWTWVEASRVKDRAITMNRMIRHSGCCGTRLEIPYDRCAVVSGRRDQANHASGHHHRRHHRHRRQIGKDDVGRHPVKMRGGMVSSPATSDASVSVMNSRPPHNAPFAVAELSGEANSPGRARCKTDGTRSAT